MKRFSFKRLLALLTVLVMCLTVFTACGDTSTDGHVHYGENAETTSISASNLITDMGLGWNLGNSFDSTGSSETSWGNPVTTEEMIDTLAELGFKTIRIPVSWSYHCDENYTIDEDWLERVQEVVDWALENDMYVILNSHHDNEVYYPTAENHDEAVNYITTIWTQIAEYFKDYDQHLIFEPMNEPRLAGTNYEWYYSEWSTECQDAMQTIIDCNQAFVDVVRASGGNNETRYLMVSTYCASPDAALSDDFTLPDDPSDKLLLTVHMYTPYNLAMSDSYAYTQFDESCESDIDYYIDALYEKFVANGTYVIIGEMGCTNKDNQSAREAWAEYFVSKAKESGMVCVVWDNNYIDAGSEAYGLFDRANLEIFDDCLDYYNGLMAGLD